MLRNETECGKFTLAKVTNGREVRIGSRPWMALLRYNETTNYRNQFACGATLISKRFVLTAAHCMNTANPVAVRLGEHNLSTEEDCVMVRSQTRCQPAPQDIGIEKIILHEGFPENVTHNDIALIKLNRDVEYSPQINSICLPLSQQKAILEQSIYLVTGWGMTENRTMSNVPMEAYVNRVDTQDCKDAYSKYAFVDTQICVSGEAQDSCSGDSGGPLQSLFRYHGQQRFVQVGIVSFGPANCGQGSLPSVYTDVMAFLPWITNQIARS
ncbi:serine protease grass-like [Drosophila obscura]|uniref:serine protease grass-like n=1 Tax=Drosophila obscura TaxID=7282 RepID=UPI001BB0EB3B|nr:serine protease grass-like [Drosophila obscura]